jgi:biotin-(acetyl-CoA carboxylase) ligase
LPNPVSLKQIANQEYELVSLANNLHEYILGELDKMLDQSASQLMELYNSLLYKKNQQVMLKQGDQMHDTVVRFVAENGNLVTDHSPEGFVFGEVEWIL